MSLFAMASGTLIGNPVERAGEKISFVTATLRVADIGESTLVSVIAFGELGERLLELRRGDTVTVSGRARLNSWTGSDGVERRGLSITANQIVTLKPSRAATASGKAKPRPASVETRRGPFFDDRVDDLWRGPA
jgi:single-stranded DNA-binding protein